MPRKTITPSPPLTDQQVMAFIMRAKTKFQKYRLDFQREFGRPLKQFWDVNSQAGLVLGFDALKFDEEVIKPLDGESTYECIERIHGKPARAMIHDILHTSPTEIT